MTIEFRCPSCQRLLTTSDDRAGAQALCPDCGSTVRVPELQAGSADDVPLLEEQDEADDWESGFGPTRQRAERRSTAEDTAGMKACPMCGEMIKAVAIRCRYCGEDLDPAAIALGRAGGDTFVFAGFWLRFVAAILDGLLMWVVVGIPLFLLTAAGNPRGAGAAFDEMQLPLNLISTLVAWLYNALMESSQYQGSLGKLAIGIKVVDESGRPVSFGQATGRHFAKILSGLICMVGYLMAAFTERKQALHDMLAHCLVVRK